MDVWSDFEALDFISIVSSMIRNVWLPNEHYTGKGHKASSWLSHTG